MTYREALYVVAHREMYDDATFHYALEIIEQHDREAGES